MSERTPKSNQGTEPSQRFERPDADTAAEGGPTHEQHDAEEKPDAGASSRDDRAHGYSQDSGYQGSGGYTWPAEERGDAPGNTSVQVRRSGNGHAASDREIGSDVQRRLLGQPAPRAGRLLISVGDGVVTLSGEVDDEVERDRLLALVREVPSVREVRDHLRIRGRGASQLN